MENRSKSPVISPIPYRGSKRVQVPFILRHLPIDLHTLWEPFVGSGAVSLGAAHVGLGKRYELGDVLSPLVGIWELILKDPVSLIDQYTILWEKQLLHPCTYYNEVRASYNANPNAAGLLYLIARCVKNAVRFNQRGEFNQSPDWRRLGMRPDVLRARVQRAHDLLVGRTSTWVGDYSHALCQAAMQDVVYMDPPYLGGGETEYYQGLDYPRFLEQLAQANDRHLSFLVSFDGRCGDHTYGQELPKDLGLVRLEVQVGRSSQATLHGRVEETVESLYLSPALVRRIKLS